MKPTPLRCFQIRLNTNGAVLRCTEKKPPSKWYRTPIRVVHRNGHESYQIHASTRKIAVLIAYREFLYYRAVQPCRN